MKTNNIHLIILFSLQIVTLNVSAQKSFFDAQIRNLSRFPPMIVTIDVNELSRAYSSREIISAEKIESGEAIGQIYSSAYTEDTRVNDALALFTRYLNRDLLAEKGDIAGEIFMNVVYYDYDYDWTIGSFINVLSFGAGYLLGIPGGVGKTRIEVELLIFDNEMRKIAEYTGTGTKKCFDGLYFPKHDIRDGNLLALKEAVRSVNDQVMADYYKIVDRLKE